MTKDLQSKKKDVREMAELVIDRIDRKLVKQTVMTSVYGVTFVGARDQIHKRLEEQGGFPEELMYARRTLHPPSTPVPSCPRKT